MVRFATGIGFLRLVISQTRWGIRCVTGIASCDITAKIGDTMCYGHWVLQLVILQPRWGVRFVSGIAFGVL